MLLSRRSEDNKRHKNVLTALKSTSGKDRKQQQMNSVSPSLKQRPRSRIMAHRRGSSSTPDDDILTQAIRLGSGSDAIKKSPPNLQAKFKKQMMEKELASVGKL